MCDNPIRIWDLYLFEVRINFYLDITMWPLELFLAICFMKAMMVRDLG